MSPLRHRRLAKPRLGTKTYRLQYTDDVSGQWQVLKDHIPGNGNPVFIADPASTTRLQHFYRLVVVGQ